MICEQCGALIDDSATVCDNCGLKLQANEKELASEFSGPYVPAIMEEPEADTQKSRKPFTNVFAKAVAVIAAALCLWLFYRASAFMNMAIVNSQSRSFMGGLFGDSASAIPPEVYAGLRSAFLATGISLSGIILILGFKKN